MAYGPKVTISAATKKRSERVLTAREQTDRDVARALAGAGASRRDDVKAARAADLAMLETATDAEFRAIVGRWL